MEVPFVASKLSGLVAPAARYVRDLVTPDSPQPEEAPVAARRDQAFFDIVSRYDIQRISPAEFSRMLQELYENNAVSDEQYRELAGIRHELDARHVDEHEQLDLLKLFSLLVHHAEATKNGNDASDRAGGNEAAQRLETLREQLKSIQRLAAIQNGENSAAVDMVA